MESEVKKIRACTHHTVGNFLWNLSSPNTQNLFRTTNVDSSRLQIEVKMMLFISAFISTFFHFTVLHLAFLNTKQCSVWLTSYSFDRLHCLCVFFVAELWTGRNIHLKSTNSSISFCHAQGIPKLVKNLLPNNSSCLVKTPSSFSPSPARCLFVSHSRSSLRYSHLWNAESCSSVSGSKGHSPCYFP